MKFETHVLENGLKILLAPSKSANTVTVMAMTGTGSRYESKKENGMAHFLEHMVFKGTKKRPNAKMIAEELDGVGGVFNAFTGKDHTAYYAKVDARHFETAFNVISDIFLNPLFPANEVKRERGTIIEEINMYHDMPMHDILNKADQTLFGKNTALGRTISGPKENIIAFSRKDFVQYFNRNYVAQNSAICIAGNFSKIKALSLARATFKTMREGAVPEHEIQTNSQDKARIALHYKKTDQTHLVIAFPSVAFNDKREATAEVLAAILGGGMSSRLFTQVRERRGLAYYVKTEHEGYDDIGNFYIRAGVTNTTTKEAIRVILKEVSGMKKQIVVPAELMKAKEYVKGTTALSLDTSDAQAGYIGYKTLVERNTKGPLAFNKAIDAVSATDVRILAKEMFCINKLNLTIIGPHKDVSLFTDLLKV